MKFKVTFTEKTPRGEETFIREAICENRQQVIEFYGLNEPDIVNYKIEAL